MAKSPCATRATEWKDYATHRPPRKWGKQAVEATKTGYARFKPGVDREAIDMGFHWKDQRNEFVLNPAYQEIEECSKYYRRMADIVGASNGKETEYVLIKWGPGGDVHGRPITTEELRQKYGVKDL